MTGDAFTFVSPEEEGDLRAIERAVGKRIERRTLQGFDPHAGSPALPEADHSRGVDNDRLSDPPLDFFELVLNIPHVRIFQQLIRRDSRRALKGKISRG